MGVYKAAIITDAGQNLVAQALAEKKTVVFTKTRTSSYAYPSGDNILGLTGLRDVVQETVPFNSRVYNDKLVQVSSRFDNDLVTQKYKIETIGSYARIEGEEEILFSVTQATVPDEMPVHSDVSPSAFIYNIQYTVQNASQIAITVNPAGTATVQDVLDLQNPQFDDSGEAPGITDFPSFLASLKSKMNVFSLYRNLKAGLKYVLHVGDIVNNCTSTDTDKPLAAAVGKVLWDKIVDAVAALTTHKSSGDHDGRYYTETEMDTKLDGKSNTNHGHSAATQSVNGFMSSADKKKLDGIAASANNYSHPTSAGNKHIPSGGSSGQILRWASDGTAAWGNDNNTTYSAATQSANGLMSAADKKKLDGVATGANNYSHPSAHAASMITQDVTHRFVTDSEKSTWNGKAAGNHNHDSAYVKKDSTAEVGGIRVGDKATDGYGWIDIYVNKTLYYSIYAGASELIFKAVVSSGLVKMFNFVNGTLMEDGHAVLKHNDLVDNCTSTATNKVPTAKQAKLLMDKCNQLNSETSGNISINTTYVTNSSSRMARWKKLGRIVTVELYDVTLKAGYSTNNVAIIGTGLPAPKDGTFQPSVTGWDNSASKVTQARLYVDSAGRLKPWYIGTTTSMSLNGSFSYISAS